MFFVVGFGNDPTHLGGFVLQGLLNDVSEGHLGSRDVVFFGDTGDQIPRDQGILGLILTGATEGGEAHKGDVVLLAFGNDTVDVSRTDMVLDLVDGRFDSGDLENVINVLWTIMRDS